MGEGGERERVKIVRDREGGGGEKEYNRVGGMGERERERDLTYTKLSNGKCIFRLVSYLSCCSSES